MGAGAGPCPGAGGGPRPRQSRRRCWPGHQAASEHSAQAWPVIQGQGCRTCPEPTAGQDGCAKKQQGDKQTNKQPAHKHTNNAQGLRGPVWWCDGRRRVKHGAGPAACTCARRVCCTAQRCALGPAQPCILPASCILPVAAPAAIRAYGTTLVSGRHGPPGRPRSAPPTRLPRPGAVWWSARRSRRGLCCFPTGAGWGRGRPGGGRVSLWRRGGGPLVAREITRPASPGRLAPARPRCPLRPHGLASGPDTTALPQHRAGPGCVRPGGVSAETRRRQVS